MNDTQAEITRLREEVEQLEKCDDQLGRACEASARGRSRTLAVSAVGAGRVPDFSILSFCLCTKGWGPIRVVQDLDKVAAERCVLHGGTGSA